MEIKRKDRFTVVASEYITPDSDVLTGGGTDRTAELQSLLDKAGEWGGLHLIVDGAYLTRTLFVSSHTTVECVNESCGFFLMDGVTAPLIINKHVVKNGERVDEDIRFIGGTYNFNCTKQEHHRTVKEGTDDLLAEHGTTGFRIFGVKGFTMKDLVLRDQRTYAAAIGNVMYANFENIRIELPNIMFAQNQDGIHIFGESRFITMRGISGTAGDDFIALASDELDGVSSIADVLIDGVHLNNSDQGIRLLSHGKGRLDRVIIKNVTGTYKSYGFFINPWESPEYKEDERHGSFGSITIENVELRQEGKKYDYTRPHLFRLGGIIDTLRVRRVRWEVTGDDSDFMQIGGEYIFFDDRASDCKTEVGKIILSDIEIEERGVHCRGIVVKDSDVGLISASDIYSDVPFVVAEGGRVKKISLRNDFSGGADEDEIRALGAEEIKL